MNLSFDRIIFFSICISFVGIPITGQLGLMEYYAKIGIRAFGELYFFLRYVIAFPQFSKYLRRANLIIFFYIFLAVVSTGYSPHPINSGLRALEILGAFCAVNVLIYKQMTWEDVDDFMKFIYVAMFVLLVIVGTAWYFTPKYSISYLNIRGDEPRLGGLFINPNMLGVYAGILFIGSFHRILSRASAKRVWYLLIIVSFIFLLLSKSRTAVGGTLIGAFIGYLLMCYSRKKYVSVRIVLGLAVVTVAGTLFYDKMLVYIFRGESISLISKATGRVNLWSSLLEKQYWNNMLFGSGFQMLGDTIDRLYKGKRMLYLPSAHNAYIQALIGLGIVGFILLATSSIMTFVYYIRRSIRLRFELSNHSAIKQDLLPALAGICTLIMIHSFFEAGHGGALSPVTIVFLYLVALYAKARMGLVKDRNQ